MRNPWAESPLAMVGFKARSHPCRFYSARSPTEAIGTVYKNPHPQGWGKSGRSPRSAG
ncbi:hypothetical protein NG799_11560 [Laspinema sp. D1]|uniref:Uncharacterized protein n=1 Tax=Laspinema palackyanum D2a TaxID=2953684 RepID=A0ABT2MQE8_9CYAN|nr:hypothetical protein [Laspinema sp. D2a]